MNPKTKCLVGLVVLTGLNGLGQTAPSSIQFSAAAYSVAEDAGKVLITVVRTGDTNPVVTVDYAAREGTAKAGEDFEAAAGTVRFAAGESSQTIQIAIRDDGQVEGDERLTVELSNPSGGAALGSPSQAQLTLIDNELPARLVDNRFNPEVSGTSTSSFIVQNDGRILSTASLFTGDGQPGTANVVRLNTDGTLDPGFSFTMNLGSANYFTLVLAATSEGKVLIGGAFKKVGTVARAGIARLDPNGELDGTFDPGSGPSGVLNQDTNARVEVICLQPDGKAIIGGVFSRFNGQAHAGLARLNVDGSLDTNFNARVNVSPGDIKLLPDGKILVGGGFTMVNGVTMGNIARLNADGTLDPDFHSKYIGGGSVVRVAPQPDGKVIIGGSFTTNGTTFRPIARLNPDGTADTKFVPGFIGDAAGHSGVVFTVGVQTDGKIVIAGSFAMVGGVPRSNLARLLPDGSVDRSFDFPLDNFPTTMVVQPDDDILLGGNFSMAGGINRSGMVRVHGQLDRVHTVEFVSAEYSVKEGAGAATLTVQRTGDTTSAASVEYATSDGTALAGSEYLPQAGRLDFAPFEVTKAITVPVLADALVEENKTVGLRLRNPSMGTQLGEKATATLTILDDDEVPRFVEASLFVNENAGLATITLRRGGDLKQAISLEYATSDGTAAAGKDYTPEHGTVTFAPGGAIQVIQIPILDNGLVQGTRTVNLSVSNPTIFPKPSTATLRIVDNELPVLFDPSYQAGPGALGESGYPCAYSLLLQPDGKAVIGGCFTNVGGLSRNGIARLNQDGSVDESFDPGSGVSGSSSVNGTIVFALALQPDGKVILGGAFFRVEGRIHPSLARVNPDGTIDETFNAQLLGLGRGYPDVRQVVVQPNGAILFVGYYPDGLGMGQLNPDGSVDTTFSSQPGLPTAPIYQLTIASQADGKIIALVSSGSDQRSRLIRMHPDGSLDPTFTSALPASLGSGNFSVITSQSDGKVVAGGFFYLPNGQTQAAIVRLNADGTVDSTFHAQPPPDLYVQQLLALPEGKVLAVGYLGLARFNADGSLDRTFALKDATTMGIQPDGLMLAVGNFPGGVVRLFPNLDQMGGPRFVAETVQVSETIGAVVLEVQRLGDTSQEMTVDFITLDETARAGLDYVGRQGVLRFAPFQLTNNISISILNDALVDGAKSFQVLLSHPSSGSALQRSSTATVIINSNDSGIQFASDRFTGAEAAGFAEVLVTRAGDGLTPAAVDYSMSDGTAQAGSDYLPRTGTITFAAGVTNQTIQVPLVDDGAVEGDETVRLILGSPRGGAMLGARTNATLVIMDNEIPTRVDPSFNPGTGATDTAGNPLSLNWLEALPDGKTLVFGDFTRFDRVSRNLLARLNPDGTVDADFQSTLLYSLSRMKAQPDGKVLITYNSIRRTVANLARLQTNGSPDAAFHSTRFESSAPAGAAIQALALQLDGKILIGGTFDRADGVRVKNLARFNADGNLDTTFQATLMGGVRSMVSAIVLAPDGKILINGDFTLINGTPMTGSARLNADGSLDGGFSMPGLLMGSLFLAVQPDGKILAKQGAIVRFNSDGSKDASFQAPSGYIYSSDFGVPFVLQDDGKLLFLGAITETGASRDGLIRLEPDGALDVTLQPLVLRNRVNMGTWQSALAVQADGKILVAGSFAWVNGTPRAGLARLFGDQSGPPVLAVGTAQATASEGAGLAFVTIQRTGDTSRAASVDYATFDGTALANVNYVSTRGTLDFAPLENQKTIVIPLIDDELPSTDTDLSLTLSHPSDGTLLNPGVNATRLIITDGQRPGSVDFSFNPRIETTNPTSTGYRIALQPDGNVIVAGDFQQVNGVIRNGICRLHPDGSLDASFDPKGGLMNRDESGNEIPVVVDTLALQPDGKILVRGAFHRVNGLIYTNFVRFNPEGSVDTRFVPDPAAQMRGFYDHGAGMAVQADGKILVAEGGGCCGIKPNDLARLEADGSADPTFVTVQVAGTSGGWGSTFKCIIVEGDGTTLLEGGEPVAGAPLEGSPQQGMTRLNSDGSIDRTFHPMMDRVGGGDGGSRTLAVVQPDGKIVIAGIFSQVNGLDRPGLARLNADGSTDASFAPVNENVEYSGLNVLALALQADGKILLSGRDGLIIRLNADGSRDRTFEGVQPRLESSYFAAISSEIVVQPDGQILFAMVLTDYTSSNGNTSVHFVRLNGDAFLANSRARLRSITGAGSARVQLDVGVIPNRTYAIQASSDLVNWTVISSRSATNYLWNVSDVTPGTERRFYRVVQTAP